MKLFHVVYGGIRNIDVPLLASGTIDTLEGKIGKRFKTTVSEIKTVFVDHPSDMENLINTLDDLLIPFAEEFHYQSGLYLIVTFVLKNVDNRNPEVLDFISKIDSIKGK
ncbi:hypothetical protein BI032_gp117 [Citrobacter phage vB_CfrM_CfP1]|jgi:hypothetical protein|uniref:Uncharacterized protein n=1 Tax=Citrobacter phage vB_CfrM_CfP1 TaxID=1871313 RepID=A0A1B1IXS4_9CAUD|nr:hypothetical protein BI032_gp117 [Citrobacter phage vB_CfrM_CfP1]ANS06087.1 hypothetical protein ABCD_0232 [Citrobacter phage vB_CfrM_CfP1]QPX73174.1 hypothetical protein [Citrobacter phage vB_Cfr_Xman]